MKFNMASQDVLAIAVATPAHAHTQYPTLWVPKMQYEQMKQLGFVGLFKVHNTIIGVLKDGSRKTNLQMLEERVVKLPCVLTIRKASCGKGEAESVPVNVAQIATAPDGSIIVMTNGAK